MPPRRSLAPKRSAPQTKPLAHQSAKKKASSNPVIPQKLSYEKGEKELKDVVQKDVKSSSKSKKATRSEGEPEETVLLPSSRSSKKEGGLEKAGISNDLVRERS